MIQFFGGNSTIFDDKNTVFKFKFVLLRDIAIGKTSILNRYVNKCLNYIDVLVDGPYVDELNDEESNIKGSKNQRVIYINEKLKEKYSLYIKGYREVEEFRILNRVVMVGIPTREYIEKFIKGGKDSENHA